MAQNPKIPLIFSLIAGNFRPRPVRIGLAAASPRLAVEDPPRSFSAVMRAKE
jgi:hypothetical protein